MNKVHSVRQIVSAYLPANDGRPNLEIRLDMSFHLPGEQYADVSMDLNFITAVPVSFHDFLHQHVTSGVHGGLAISGLPLPDDGLWVTVHDLQIDPLPNIDDSGAVRLCGTLIQKVTMGAVAGLWSSLHALQ